MIALDVLHPSVYLWTLGKVEGNDFKNKFGEMKLAVKFVNLVWWKSVIASIILNETLASVFKLMAPLYT